MVVPGEEGAHLDAAAEMLVLIEPVLQAFE